MKELPAVERRIRVRLAPADAFELFTVGLARWWPFAGHACSGQPAGVAFDARVGGAVTEIGADGTRHPWGTLTVWEPPHGFAMSWHPGQAPALATRLAVRFAAVTGGCEVHLVHDGWAARGADAQTVRDGYDQGWDRVLGQYRQHADAATSTEEQA